MSDQYELLPCPFCGSPANSSNGILPLESVTYAFCTNNECVLQGTSLFTPEEWNQRSRFHENTPVEKWPLFAICINGKFSMDLSSLKGSVKYVREDLVATYAYPHIEVNGPCLCGSWPGGSCLNCPQKCNTRATPPTTADGDRKSNDAQLAKEWQTRYEGQVVLANGANLLNEKYSDVLRELCSWLGAGGFNSEGLISPETANEKIRWGVDHIVEVEKRRAADGDRRDAERYRWFAEKVGFGTYGVAEIEILDKYYATKTNWLDDKEEMDAVADAAIARQSSKEGV